MVFRFASMTPAPANSGGRAQRRPGGRDDSKLLLTQALTHARNPRLSLSVKATKKAPLRGLHEKRMMGLEPTTFCMASRRSSQLSYIRERRPV